eukprot:1158260-Pelagomonas_calceolata.AAC.4
MVGACKNSRVRGQQRCVGTVGLNTQPNSAEGQKVGPWKLSCLDMAGLGLRGALPFSVYAEHGGWIMSLSMLYLRQGRQARPVQ